MLDRHPLRIPRGPVWIAYRQHSHRSSAEHGHRDQPFLVPDRAGGRHRPGQDQFPSARVGPRIGSRPVRACPRAQVAEPVLDGRRTVGQLVHRAGDAVLALVGQRDPGQPVVDLHAPPQGQVGDLEFPGPFTFPVVQVRVGQRARGLLRQHLQQETLAFGQRPGRPYDQVAARPVRAGQRIGPRPRHIGQLDLAAAREEYGSGHRGARRALGRSPAARDLDVLPPAVEVDAPQLTPPQRFDRVRDHVQDGGLTVLLGQQHGQHKQAPQRGKLLAGRAVAVALTGRSHRLTPHPGHATGRKGTGVERHRGPRGPWSPGEPMPPPWISPRQCDPRPAIPEKHHASCQGTTRMCDVTSPAWARALRATPKRMG